MAISALLMQSNFGGYAGNHAHYFLGKPIVDPGTNLGYENVVVFSTNFGGHAETIIVPARPDGTSPVLTRLPGSLVGIEDHAGALWAAGGFCHGEPYEIEIPAPPEEESDEDE